MTYNVLMGTLNPTHSLDRTGTNQARLEISGTAEQLPLSTLCLNIPG